MKEIQGIIYANCSNLYKEVEANYMKIKVFWNSGSWWWTRRPGVLQYMGSQRVRHDWATELNWTRFFKEVLVTQCVILFATPWTVAHQAPLSLGFSRQEYWSGMSFPFPADFPNPGIEPESPALQANSLPSKLPGKPYIKIKYVLNM